MATKILKIVQDIAHDQLTIASTLQSLIDTYHVYSDEIKDYEVTPFGANQFIVSLLFLWLQQEWALGMIKLPVGLGRLVKMRLTKTAIVVLKTLKTDLFGFKRTISPKIVLALIKTFRAKYVRSASVITVMATTALDFLFDHYWKASLLLGIGVSSLKNFNQGAIMGSICRTQNFRAWYNAVEVEQEI
jgi:hypothetical protein